MLYENLRGDIRAGRIFPNQARSIFDPSPLQWAVSQGRLDDVEFLLENGGDLFQNKFKPMLFHAVDHPHLFRYLVDKGCDIKGTLSGQPLLHAAAECGQIETARFLLESKADIEAQTPQVGSALHVACIKKDVDMVKFLIEHKANVNAQNREGETPLHVAFLHQAVNCARELIFADANVFLKNRAGEIPGDFASKKLKRLLFKPYCKQALSEHLIPKVSNCVLKFLGNRRFCAPRPVERSKLSANTLGILACMRREKNRAT